MAQYIFSSCSFVIILPSNFFVNSRRYDGWFTFNGVIAPITHGQNSAGVVVHPPNHDDMTGVYPYFTVIGIISDHHQPAHIAPFKSEPDNRGADFKSAIFFDWAQLSLSPIAQVWIAPNPIHRSHNVKEPTDRRRRPQGLKPIDEASNARATAENHDIVVL